MPTSRWPTRAHHLTPCALLPWLLVQLARACAQFALPIPEGHLGEIFERFDLDGSGMIDFNEFVNYLKNFDLKWASTEEKLRARKIGA